MRTIYRYDLPVNDSVGFFIPSGAELLSVGHSRLGPISPGTVSVWAVVDPDQPDVERTVLMRGTGHPLDGTEGRFLGTVDFVTLVWHLFEPRVGD